MHKTHTQTADTIPFTLSRLRSQSAKEETGEDGDISGEFGSIPGSWEVYEQEIRELEEELEKGECSIDDA